MLVKNIGFLTYLEDIINIENNFTYTIVIVTAKNIKSLVK